MTPTRRVLMVRASALLSVAVAMCAVWLAAPVSDAAFASPTPAFAVHRYANPEFAHLNAYVIETRRHVVLIDAGASEIDGARLRAMVSRIGKPVQAVLLTHGHIDHYGGIASAVDEHVPVISGSGTARQVADYDDLYFARIPTVFPKRRRLPQRIFGHGESLTVDGVAFTLHELGPGESFADVWWSVEARGSKAAFIGDVAMYGIHAFFQSGRSAAWLRSLHLLQKQMPADAAIFLGHDTDPVDSPPTTDGLGKIAWQIACIERYREAVRSIAQGRAHLSGADVARVAAKMSGMLPKDRLDFLPALGANVVAAELALEAAQANLEVNLRRLFAN